MRRSPLKIPYVGSMLLATTSAGAIALTSTMGAAQTVRPEPGPEFVLDTITIDGSSSSLGTLTPQPPYAGGQIATGAQLGVLGNRPVLDTPFNFQAYTNKLIADQQARSIADILNNDASTRVGWSPAAGSGFLEYSMRGFLVNSQDLTFDGLAGVTPIAGFPPEGLERIDVLKGPSAMLNGASLHGSLGGVINVVPKRAFDTPVTQLTTIYDSKSQFGTHVDFGRRFGDADRFGLRFNGVYRNGETTLDRQSLELGYGALALDYRGERFRMSVDLGYHDQTRDQPLNKMGVRPGFTIPAPPQPGSNFQQPWGYMGVTELYGIARAEYDVSPDWTVFAAIGHRNSKSETLDAISSLINAQGDIAQTYAYTPRTFDTTSGEIGVRGRFHTGAVKHEISVVGAALEQEQKAFNSIVPGGLSNIYRPTPTPLPAIVNLTGIPVKSTINSRSSLAFADTMSILDDRIQLMLAGRLQRILTDAFHPATGARAARYDKTALTPAYGMVIKPVENVSLYGNYIEGLTQPVPPGAALNSTAVFPPMRTRQIEAGIKVDFGALQTTVSAFQIMQPTTILDPVTFMYDVTGEQRVRGLDFNVVGSAFDGIRVLGGVTLLSSELTRTATDSDQGNRGVGVPDVQFNFGVEWDTPFVEGLTLSGRAIYTGKQYADTANTQSIPAWTRVDVGAQYAMMINDRSLVLRANVENVFNSAYWASTARDLTIGQPRTFKMSAAFDF